MQTVNPVPPDYSITPDQTSATILAGQTATFRINTTALNFFTGTVRFSCGTLPPLTTCAFSIPEVVVDVANPTIFNTLTIKTTGPHASLNLPGREGSVNAALWGLGAFGLGVVLLGCVSPRKNRRAFLAALSMLALAAALSSCGGGSTPPPPPPPTPTPTPTPASATPPGTYTITVSAAGRATSGTSPANPSQQLNLSVTVQP
jgi:hypothetical protein